MAKRVHLHARDVEVLELLADRQVETLNALHAELWVDASRKRAYNRLGELARAGYLLHESRSDLDAQGPGRPRRQHLYLLGPKAPTALRLREREAHVLALRRVRSGLSAAHVEHQLATNRVGDWLGARLMSEWQAVAGLDRRRRPDGAYRAAPDKQGRELVLVEVDLGHYTRHRILEKTQGFLEHPDARDIILATPSGERADLVARWIRDAYGPAVMDRVHVLAFAELKRGVAIPAFLAPMRPETPVDNWNDLLGPPGI